MSASGNGSTINALFYRRRYRGDIPLVKNNSGEAGNVVYTDLLFGGGTGTPTLLPPLLSNTAVFYSPSITVGAVTLQPGLFTNTQSFFAPAVSQNVNAGLFTTLMLFTVLQLLMLVEHRHFLQGYLLTQTFSMRPMSLIQPL